MICLAIVCVHNSTVTAQPYTLLFNELWVQHQDGGRQATCQNPHWALQLTQKADKQWISGSTNASIVGQNQMLWVLKSRTVITNHSNTFKSVTRLHSLLVVQWECNLLPKQLSWYLSYPCLSLWPTLVLFLMMLWFYHGTWVSLFLPLFPDCLTWWSSHPHLTCPNLVTPCPSPHCLLWIAIPDMHRLLLALLGWYSWTFQVQVSDPKIVATCYLNGKCCFHSTWSCCPPTLQSSPLHSRHACNASMLNSAEILIRSLSSVDLHWIVLLPLLVASTLYWENSLKGLAVLSTLLSDKAAFSPKPCTDFICAQWMVLYLLVFDIFVSGRVQWQKPMSVIACYDKNFSLLACAPEVWMPITSIHTVYSFLFQGRMSTSWWNSFSSSLCRTFNYLPVCIISTLPRGFIKGL